MMALTAPEEVNPTCATFCGFAVAGDRRRPTIDARSLPPRARRLHDRRDGGGDHRTATASRAASPPIPSPPSRSIRRWCWSASPRRASSYPVFSTADSFAINVLAENQRATSGLFASKAADKFAARLAWQPSGSGSPVIERRRRPGSTAPAQPGRCRRPRHPDRPRRGFRQFAGQPARLLPRRLCHLRPGAGGAGGSAPRASAPSSKTTAALLFLANGDRFDLPDRPAWSRTATPTASTARCAGSASRRSSASCSRCSRMPRSGAGSISVYYRGTVDARVPDRPGLRVIPLRRDSVGRPARRCGALDAAPLRARTPRGHLWRLCRRCGARHRASRSPSRHRKEPGR